MSVNKNLKIKFSLLCEWLQRIENDSEKEINYLLQEYVKNQEKTIFLLEVLKNHVPDFTRLFYLRLNEGRINEVGGVSDEFQSHVRKHAEMYKYYIRLGGGSAIFHKYKVVDDLYKILTRMNVKLY